MSNWLGIEKQGQCSRDRNVGKMRVFIYGSYLNFVVVQVLISANRFSGLKNEGYLWDRVSVMYVMSSGKIISVYKARHLWQLLRL